MQDKPISLKDFLAKNSWAIAIVIVSIIAQWSIMGVRLNNIESRQDRQGTAISTLQDQAKEAQSNYAALGAKVDALSDNVLYIRTRIDTALSK